MDIIKTDKAETGFTIVEVMIAILIFSSGILSAASMQTTSLLGNSSSMKFTEASQLATNLAEGINLMSYATLTEGISETEEKVSETESIGSNGEVFTTSWVVGPENSYSGANTFKARELTVTVTWNDHNSVKNTIITFIKSSVCLWNLRVGD